MEKPQIPIKKQESSTSRQPRSFFDFEEETEEHRQEVFLKADDGDELSFDVPRD